jgi:hypothetical protein
MIAPVGKILQEFIQVKALVQYDLLAGILNLKRVRDIHTEGLKRFVRPGDWVYEKLLVKKT